MSQRSLYTVPKVYYRSTSCFAMDSPTKGPACSAKDSLAKGPSCTMCFRWIIKYVTKYDTKNDDNSHSTKQDTLPTTFLIIKQIVPYRTHGGTCCPVGSTPKIRSLADSSTTCHDGINCLHLFNHFSNYNIDPHIVNSHLDGWKTTTLLQRHKSNQHHKGWKSKDHKTLTKTQANSTSQSMERLARLSRLHG
jgi:hypothetical protein